MFCKKNGLTLFRGCKRTLEDIGGYYDTLLKPTLDPNYFLHSPKYRELLVWNDSPLASKQ